MSEVMLARKAAERGESPIEESITPVQRVASILLAASNSITPLDPETGRDVMELLKLYLTKPLRDQH